MSNQQTLWPIQGAYDSSQVVNTNPTPTSQFTDMVQQTASDPNWGANTLGNGPNSVTQSNTQSSDTQSSNTQSSNSAPISLSLNPVSGGGGEIASGTLGGAGVGAKLGSMVLPGVGTAVGTGIGAVVGAALSWYDAEQTKKAEEKANDLKMKMWNQAQSEQYSQQAGKAEQNVQIKADQEQAKARSDKAYNDQQQQQKFMSQASIMANASNKMMMFANSPSTRAIYNQLWSR
jgi:outer membrane lipoprotein SlyB